MATGGGQLADKLDVVHAFGPATPSSASPDWISLKSARSFEVVVIGLNGTTVTGSAVALSQATLVNGANAKTLPFTSYFSNTDPVNSSVLSSATAASNTFTTVNTNSLTFEYRIPIDPSTLDTTNGFDCVRVTLGNGANTSVCAFYLVEPAYGGKATAGVNHIVD
jgi:hypothetical protein